MTTELPIEREANLRAQKKKILQLQRLKYSSAAFAITDDKEASSSRDKHFLFAQEKRPNLSDYLITLKDENAVACEKVGPERLTSNLATIDNNYAKVNKLERRESPGFAVRNKTLVSPRRERQFTENTTENYEEGTKTDGMNISIVIDNAEPEKYTACSASASSEYHRKTTEIKKKADERRRNGISPSIRHSSVLDMRSNNEEHLTVDDFQPRRSTSLSDLNSPYEELDSKRANTSHKIRKEIFDRSSPQVFGERSSLLRASSWSSLYEVFHSRETEEEVNFQGFARKQQEMLENNLRRVEQNLDTTFSRLRRYVNTGTAINSTDSSEQT